MAIGVLIDESLEGARMTVDSLGPRPIAAPRPQLAAEREDLDDEEAIEVEMEDEEEEEEAELGKQRPRPSIRDAVVAAVVGGVAVVAEPKVEKALKLRN